MAASVVRAGTPVKHPAAGRCGGVPPSGAPSRRIPVDVSGLHSFRAAFVTNSRGIAPLGQIDDLSLPVGGTLLATLTEANESAGWDPSEPLAAHELPDSW